MTTSERSSQDSSSLHGMQENNLFHTRDELVAIAYQRQAEQIEFSASQISQPA